MNEQTVERIRVLTHSSIRIEAEDGMVLYFDPYNLVEDAHDADFIFITHSHYDHFSTEDIARIAKEGSELVVPASMADEAPSAGVNTIRAVNPGDRLEVGGMAVEVVPAYNVEPERLGFHPRANNWVGYIVTVDGTRVYVAGDTDQNPDTLQVSCDIALIPIAGTYTMDPDQAAGLINTIKPRVAIPTHYGSVVGTMEDADTFASKVDPGVIVVKKLER